MKKIFLCLIGVLLVSGCGKTNSKKLIDELNKKIEESKSYQITATLEIFRNEEKFTYDVYSTYKNEGFFKVELMNTMNQHNQIILKDNESIYVITPSLNKIFKFQSEWPYNNSQIYLLQPVILDVKNDSKAGFQQNNKGYIVTSKVNYTSEKKFKKQKIYFDKEKNITKIEVVDNNDNVMMCFKIKNIQFGLNLDKNFFDVSKYEKKAKDTNSLDESSSNSGEDTVLDKNNIIYPMYIPVDTYLASQDIINTGFGERIISTFSGNSEFTIIQEMVDNKEKTEYVYGDPYLILDTVGAITDQSITWISRGIEYSVISNNMALDELLTVAQSINVRTVGK